MCIRDRLTKPKISEIALHLFAERGYAAVSMRQIASKVGLQVGALYNYFPDKQTILSELLIMKVALMEIH